MTDLTLTTERKINAAPEKVFNAWLNPEMLRRFMHPGEGVTVPHAKSDAKVGGRFEIPMDTGENILLHQGEYLAIDPHERIVFTWDSPYSPADSEVTLTFAPEGDGTLLRLTQVRFMNEEMRDNHQKGWTSIMAALDALLVNEAA